MMDDLPEIVFVDAVFTCQNIDCEAAGIALPITMPDGCGSVVCGPCGQESAI